MELRCPECVSPEVGNDPQGGGEARRCGNCGARFPRDAALLSVLEAEAYRGEEALPPIFTFHPALCAIELRRGGGAITTVNPYSDADELQRLLDDAQVAQIIDSARPRAAICIYPLSVSEPDPLLAVNTGVGLTVLGFELELRQREGEDPIAFTVHFLAEVVEEANGLAAGRAADSERLDRIAAFMSRTRPWGGAEVCEYLAEELRESGRRLLDR